MEKIKVYIDYNDRIKKHYYEYFDIIEELPKINAELMGYGLSQTATVEKIESVSIDCEQASEEVYNYNYYYIYVNVYNKDYDETDQDILNVCIKKEDF